MRWNANYNYEWVGGRRSTSAESGEFISFLMSGVDVSHQRRREMEEDVRVVGGLFKFNFATGIGDLLHNSFAFVLGCILLDGDGCGFDEALGFL